MVHWLSTTCLLSQFYFALAAHSLSFHIMELSVFAFKTVENKENLSPCASPPRTPRKRIASAEAVLSNHAKTNDVVQNGFETKPLHSAEPQHGFLIDCDIKTIVSNEKEIKQQVSMNAETEHISMPDPSGDALFSPKEGNAGSVLPNIDEDLLLLSPTAVEIKPDTVKDGNSELPELATGTNWLDNGMNEDEDLKKAIALSLKSAVRTSFTLI